MIDAGLDAAYRATRYCVDLPHGDRVALRVGEVSAGFAQALKSAGAARWAIVVAANPGSTLLSSVENERRHQALLEAVASSGRCAWTGINEAGDGHWPAEPALCILDISLPEALRLAAAFGQNAIIAGDAKGLPLLHWVAPALGS